MAVQFTSFTSVSEAARCVQEFLMDRDAALPDDVREKLKALVGPTSSPVDTVVRGSEIMYARREELAPEALALAGGLALLAEQYNFHGMAEEQRGSKMALAMMRDAKIKKPVGIEYPDKEKDPAPKAEYAPLPEPTEIDLPQPVPATVEDMPPAEGTRRGRGRRDRNRINTR